MTDLLQLETVDEFLRVFEGDEKDVRVCIGTTNITSKEGIVTYSIVISSRLKDEDGDVMMFRYSEVIDSAPIPPEPWKDSESKAYQEEYNNAKVRFDTVVNLVNSKKDELIKKFQGKGFEVIQGVWFI
jgi:hypothetical protein